MSGFDPDSLDPALLPRHVPAGFAKQSSWQFSNLSSARKSFLVSLRNVGVEDMAVSEELSAKAKKTIYGMLVRPSRI